VNVPCSLNMATKPGGGRVPIETLTGRIVKAVISVVCFEPRRWPGMTVREKTFTVLLAVAVAIAVAVVVKLFL